MTRSDCRQLATSATDQAEVDAFDAGFEQFLNYEMSAGNAIKAVLARYPESVSATILRGYMMMMLETSAVHAKVAGSAASALESGWGNGRERLHLQALRHWAAGDVRAAAASWDRILADHPLDLLALKMHHYTTFWTGRANVLLSAVDGVVDAWDESVPGYDHVLGMRAFALNETGRYEQAEELGRQAVALNDEDLWSIHAVAHALEMQGALSAGDAFFAEFMSDDPSGQHRWQAKNPFVGHIWWHAALFPWNAGDYERVLQLYDERLRPTGTEFFLDLQNLSSLLARLELSGVDVGDRWDELGDHAASRIGDHVLTFTDVHCAMTLSRTGRRRDLTAFVESLEQHRAGRPQGPDGVGLDVAIELCRGFERRAAADNEGAAEILLAVRGDLAPIGGSHAQRDLFDLVLADTVVATGDHRLAANLARARTRRWPNSVPTWRHYAKAAAALDDQAEVDRANRRAEEVVA
ncbi:MAG: tetratricopeptide repeat protein [Acidimicrobiales bacterium]